MRAVRLAAARRQVAGLRALRERRPVEVVNVVISTQHTAGRLPREIEGFLIGTSSGRYPLPASSPRERSFSSIRPAGLSSAARRATPASPAARSSWTPTAAGAATAAAPFRARIPRRWTVRPPICAAGWPRTSSPRALRNRGAPGRLRHRLPASGQRLCRHHGDGNGGRREDRAARSTRSSASNPPTSSPSSTSCARSTARRPTTAISANPAFRGNARTRRPNCAPPPSDRTAARLPSLHGHRHDTARPPPISSSRTSPSPPGAARKSTSPSTRCRDSWPCAASSGRKSP